MKLWHAACYYQSIIETIKINRTDKEDSMTRHERVEKLKTLLKVEANNLIYECETEKEMIALQELCDAIDRS